MTRLSDLFSESALADAIRERLVVARHHPFRNLTILNYTERCQYERGLWNEVTIQCRGIIHDGNGEIYARPFRKFFNYGQSEAPTLDLNEPAVVTDKLDGSLGILYGFGNSAAIATRGSFDSEQAHHATAVWQDTYSEIQTPEGWTLLFEIVYPENRIVIDYGERDDLILLGAVNIATGKSIPPTDPILADWPGLRAEVFPYASLASALAAPPRPNAEGFVVHMMNSDERVKIKQEDYVALHRIVTGLNERTVWEHLVEGKEIGELLAPLPDEFHGWVGEVAARLQATVEIGAAEVEHAYSTILATLPENPTRKDFALAAIQNPRKHNLFARHDGKDYRRALWDECYPQPRIGPRGLTPDEATA